MSLHFHPKPLLPRRKFVFFGMLAPVAVRAVDPQKPEHHHAHPALPSAQHRTAAHPSRQVFDAHLHCPDDDGNVWQWYPVTRTFEEFDAYLAKTGVQRGIINSVRSQQSKTAKEFIQGNREVARRGALSYCQVYEQFNCLSMASGDKQVKTQINLPNVV